MFIIYIKFVKLTQQFVQKNTDSEMPLCISDFRVLFLLL